MEQTYFFFVSKNFVHFYVILFSSCFNIGSVLWKTVLFYVLFYVHSTDLLCDHSTVLCDLIFILFQHRFSTVEQSTEPMLKQDENKIT